MKKRRTTCVKRNLSAKDWHPSSTKHTVMEDRSSTQSFSNHHQHHHHLSFPLTLPNFQNSEVGYPMSEPAQDSLEHYVNRGEESTSSYLTSNTSGLKRASSGGDGVLLSTSASSLEGDGNLGGHLDGDNRLGSHFDDSWYGKKELWEDGESCEGTADDFHVKGDCYGNMNDVFYAMSCTEEEDRRKIRANHHSCVRVSCETKSETAHNNMSHFTKQAASYNRVGAGSCNGNIIDYCRADSRASDHYFRGEEDYGSSCGSGEDQLHPADAEAQWFSVSPTSQAGGRWRGAADPHALSLGGLSPIGLSSRTYSQKLDSFSEAFLSQRKRLPIIPIGNSSGQMWELGAGRGETSGLTKSRQSCAFDSDSYLPPSSSSSSSPAYPSLPSFPSPPTSSHLMSSVLSPPPTPLPPPSHSPSKMDSPSAQGSTGQSISQGGDSLGGLQFFPSRIQSLPSVHSSGMIWKFPLLSHCFQPLPGNPGGTDCNLKPSQADDYGNATATCNIPQSSESSSLASSSHPSPLHSAVCPSSNPSFNSSFHLPFRTSQLSGKHHEAAEKASPYKGIQKIKNEPGSLIQSCLQKHPTPVYTGTPFSSFLQSRNTENNGRYTPRPLLNPVRRGTGLYSSLTSLHHREEESCDGIPCVNVGRDFQADLPPCFSSGEWSGMWLPEEESPREQLLWKPWDELEESARLQDQVEKLLSMCSSSCLPGGGSNTELALHYLHCCQGNTMATLEMLLFCQSSPTGNYHYSGCDFWTDTEKNLFHVALGSSGKDFSLIQKMVRTKTVSQCVEFYYLSKKLVDKQKKQMEDECRARELELQKSVTPISRPVERQFSPGEAVPVPPLANFFPCKLCGKMFYKIKSRNAHMKIHRQPQDDWGDRRLQHQLLTQRLALSHPTNLMPSPSANLLPPQAAALTFSSSGLPTNSNADNIHNSVANSNPITPSNTSMLDRSSSVAFSNIAPLASRVITISNVDGSDSNQREPTTVSPFHQTWGSFGQPLDLTTFYCVPEGKEDVGAVEGKEPMSWQ